MNLILAPNRLMIEAFGACVLCGMVLLRILFSGEAVGIRCKKCDCAWIYLDGKRVSVPKRILGLRLQEILLLNSTE
jgi:hypothetical protein